MTKAREITGENFVGDWNVTIASDEIPPAGKQMRIRAGDVPGHYLLCERVGDDCKDLQTLELDAATGTLRNLPNDRERCISLWRRSERNGGPVPDSIFAKRIRKPDGAVVDGQTASWENDDLDGVWGAEDGRVSGGSGNSGGSGGG